MAEANRGLQMEVPGTSPSVRIGFPLATVRGLRLSWAKEWMVVQSWWSVATRDDTLITWASDLTNWGRDIWALAWRDLET